MKVGTNTPSLFAQRALSGTSNALANSLRRLSSGLRVNSASDDAAGLAIASRMTTQVRGMSQAARNASDGISMLQTADSVIATVTANLQRARELSVQAANSSNSASDRAALSVEVRQLLAEINRTSGTAEFNGQKIFAQNGGSIGGDVNQRAVVDGLKLGWLQESESLISNLYGLTADGAAMQIDITADTDGAGGVAAFVSSATGGQPGGRGTNLRLSVDMADFTPPNLPNGGTAPFYNDRIIAHEMVHAVMARATNWESLTTTSTWFVEGAAEFIHGADERVAGDIAAAAGATLNDRIDAVVDQIATWQLTSVDYSAGYIGVRYLHDKLRSAGFSGLKDFMTYLNGAGAPTMDQAMTHFFGGGYTQASFLAEIQADSGNGLSNGVMFVNNRMNLTNTDTGAIGGLDADFGPIKTAGSILSDIGTSYGDDVLQGFTETWQGLVRDVTASRQATLQIGADVGQTNNVEFGAISAEALGISDLDLSQNARVALVHIDEALEYLNRQRATIGAQLSRVEYTINSLQGAVENTAASRSRILDADYAAETATLVRSQILQQAGAAVLAQANAQPQLVLSLLRA